MSTTLVCDEKIYQSGQNVRQLLLDKRFSAESESICSKTQTLEPHQSLVIPTCSFVHVHSNKELVFDFNVGGNITTRRGSFVTCGFEYDEVTVTNPSKESAIVYMVYQIPFQYKAPEIEMAVDPPAGVTVEIGQEIEQIVFDITAIRGTRDIEAIKVYRDNLLIYSKSDVVTSQHFSFTYKPKTPIVESTKFKFAKFWPNLLWSIFTSTLCSKDLSFSPSNFSSATSTEIKHCGLKSSGLINSFM